MPDLTQGNLHRYTTTTYAGGAPRIRAQAKSVQAQVDDFHPDDIGPGRRVDQYPLVQVKGEGYLLEEWFNLRNPRTSWIFTHGQALAKRTEGDELSELRWWLCNYCDKKGDPSIFNIKSTSACIRHLRQKHNVTEHGEAPSDTTESQSTSVLQQQVQASRRPTGQSRHNKFMDLLLGFITDCDIPINAVQRAIFREFLEFLDKETVRNCLSATGAPKKVRKLLAATYKKRKYELRRDIAAAKSRIHLSWDLWTSPNHKAILAVVAHYVDWNYRLQNRLLALEELTGAHSGANQALTMLSVMDDYEITTENIGYFVGDNVKSNDHVIRHVLHELYPQENKKPNFDIPHPREYQYRLRCINHILNLVAKAFIFGKNHDTLDLELTEVVDTPAVRDQFLKAWRKRGPVGKLHNTVKFIRSSPQRQQVSDN